MIRLPPRSPSRVGAARRRSPVVGAASRRRSHQPGRDPFVDAPVASSLPAVTASRRSHGRRRRRQLPDGRRPQPLAGRREADVVTIDTRRARSRSPSRPTWAPLAAGNFVDLAGCGFYDGVVFHRVVPDFVIQGGDPTGHRSAAARATDQGRPGDGAVQARHGRDGPNAGPNTTGRQFFIVLEDDAAGASRRQHVLGLRPR